MDEISFFDRNISNDEMYQYKYIIKNNRRLEDLIKYKLRN